MTRINPVPGEYNILSREDVFPDAVVAKLADDYKIDDGRLRDALEIVVLAYDDAGHWFTRYPLHLEAQGKAKASLAKLRAVRREWARASDGIKQTIAANFDNYSADIMLAQIDGIIAVMEELVDCRGRGRGNPGGARKSAGVDLNIFKGCVEELNRLWLAERGKPLGHEIEYEHYRERDGAVEIYAVPKSQGIMFLRDCLARLDDRVTIESCRTLVRAAKKRAAR